MENTYFHIWIKSGGRYDHLFNFIIVKRRKNEFENKRVEIYPCNRPWRPIEIRRKFHIFWIIGSQMAVRLSVLRTGIALLPRKIPGTHFA
jgi:hypothetical protein